MEFLDLTIFKGERFKREGVLDLKSHIKTTETFQYLDRTSAHSFSCFKGFVGGEILRHNRLCSNEVDFIERVNNFRLKLIDRGYSSDEITPVINKIDHSQRQLNLNKVNPPQEGPPLVMKLTYSPHFKNGTRKKGVV